MHRLDVQVGSQVITVELLDTSGYGSFPAMREVAIRQADGFLLIFAPDCEESLECIKSLRQDILRIKQSEQNVPVIPMVVVCNKMDLDIAQHKVDLPYVDFLVKCDWENCGLIQASAKDDYGVQEAFRELLLGLKLRLPPNTVVKRVRAGLSRMRSAPAGLRTEGSIKFSSPKLLQKFRERSIAVHEDECTVN
ncbi:hypothetical protein RvY_07108-2 [Ramazzottius varieornatus]|nr:hypothetical protein RvY_07108-2 [Ramazzottius varieornatus]